MNRFVDKVRCLFGDHEMTNAVLEGHDLKAIARKHGTDRLVKLATTSYCKHCRKQYVPTGGLWIHSYTVPPPIQNKKKEKKSDKSNLQKKSG